MIFKDKDGFIKISIPHNIYHKKIKEFRIMVLKESLVYSLMLLLISILFAYYTIYPLKKALQINEEFIKDILHDLNTPLTSLKINLKILQKKFGDNPIITRADNSISTIVDMQSNLKYFLVNSALQQEEFSLEDVLTKKADYYQSIFVKLSFKLDIQEDSKIICNKEAFIRIVDNIISNASKYNIDNGYVLISYRDKILTISDNGVGIKEPKRIFDRYYKESSSGIGIGLHIVKKLCDELNIAITLKTDLNIGSKFILDISGVVKD
jgi:signal transduction histidine kinase